MKTETQLKNEKRQLQADWQALAEQVLELATILDYSYVSQHQFSEWDAKAGQVSSKLTILRGRTLIKIGESEF